MPRLVAVRVHGASSWPSCFTRYQYGRQRRVRGLAISARCSFACWFHSRRTGADASYYQPLALALWLLVDGTDSMAVADDMPTTSRTFGQAAGLTSQSRATASLGTLVPGIRIDYVKALFQEDKNLLEQLSEVPPSRSCSTGRKESARWNSRQKAKLAPSIWQLTTDGQVTALGLRLDDLARRHSPSNLAGLVIVSDFNQNAGLPALTATRR